MSPSKPPRDPAAPVHGERDHERDDDRATIAFLRAIVGSAVDVVIEYDDDLRVVHASRAARRALGLAEDGDVGAPLIEWLHPDDRPAWTRHLESALETRFYEVPEVARLRLREGGHASFGVRFRTYALPSGARRTLLFGTRRAEREGRADPFAARVFLSQMFEDSPTAALLHDTAARILYANPAFCRISGHTEEDLARRTVLELLEPGQSSAFREAMMPLQMGLAEHAEVELDIRTSAGERRTIVLSGSRSDTPSGDIAILSVVLDRTEYRRAKEELIRKEKQASIGALSAGIAHEVSNPVGSILAAAQYGLACQDDVDGKRAMVESLEAIVGEAKRCGRIVRGVLKLAKSEPGRREDVYASHLLDRTREMTLEYAERRGVHVEVARAADTFQVHVCPLEIEAALENVVRNAIEASPRGSKIDLATWRNEARAVIVVRDNGRGISPEDIARVIEPFFTTRSDSGGTGLGLSIANAAITANGGELRLERNPSGGTTAVVELPLAES